MCPIVWLYWVFSTTKQALPTTSYPPSPNLGPSKRHMNATLFSKPFHISLGLPGWVFFAGCPRRVDRVSQMKSRHPPPLPSFFPSFWTVLPPRPPARALLGNHNLVLSPLSPSWRHFSLERGRVEFLSNLSCELSDHRGGLDVIAPLEKSCSLPFVLLTEGTPRERRLWHLWHHFGRC